MHGGVRREWLVLSKRPNAAVLSQVASLRARRKAVIHCVMPPWGSWLAQREHALRLTTLHLAESAISYDAVHYRAQAETAYRVLPASPEQPVSLELPSYGVLIVAGVHT